MVMTAKVDIGGDDVSGESDEMLIAVIFSVRALRAARNSTKRRALSELATAGHETVDAIHALSSPSHGALLDESMKAAGISRHIESENPIL